MLVQIGRVCTPSSCKLSMSACLCVTVKPGARLVGLRLGECGGSPVFIGLC